MKARYRKLYFPLGLCIVIYAAAAVVFGAMTPAFRTEDTPAKSIHVLWYVVIMIESVGIVAISCCWRMLSFKKTHLVERMGLLTLIVIGEGAIGVTKTVGRIMGKSGVNVEGCFLIMCIILVLVRYLDVQSLQYEID
jgi:low temperature requirement protein LtrA